jgi:hypothetical protein
MFGIGVAMAAGMLLLTALLHRAGEGRPRRRH